MKSFSLIYELFRLLTMPAIRIFYKRIQINNFENLPDKGPVFICSNHVNAFMDPVSVQLHTRRQIFSLARGDAFKKPFMRWLLTQWKLIPIYRISEGAQNLGKNEDTFLKSSTILANGNALVIYPEGICVQERRIRRLKKGAARIAFNVEEQTNFKSDLIILPLGLNYSNPKKFRSNLYMNFGEPITTSKYINLYRRDRAKALNELTAEIENAMKELVVNVHHKENDELVEDLYLLYKEQLMVEMGLEPKNLKDDFKVSCDIANGVNYLQLNEPELLEDAKQRINNYKKLLGDISLSTHLLNFKGLESIKINRVLIDSMLFILALPFIILGMIMNYPPFKFGNYMANKLAKEVEFHASINMTVGWFSWIAYYFIQLLAVGLLFHNWLFLCTYVLLAPLSAYCLLMFGPILSEVMERRKLFGLMINDKSHFELLIKEREALIKLLDGGKNRYCNYLNAVK